MTKRMFRVNWEDRWHWFATVDWAMDFAQSVFERTGVLVAVVPS